MLTPPDTNYQHTKITKEYFPDEDQLPITKSLETTDESEQPPVQQAERILDDKLNTEGERELLI